MTFRTRQDGVGHFSSSHSRPTDRGDGAVMRFTQSSVNSFKPPVGKADHVEFDDAMPGFGMRFRNGGTGTYFIQFKVGSKHGRLSLGKVSKITLDAAKTEAKKQFASVAQKIDPSAERAKAVAKASDSFEPLVGGFIAYLRREGRVASYLADNERSLRRYFRPLHRFAVADITRKMVAGQLEKIRTERGPIAATRSRAHLSRFFSWAIAHDLTGVNPVTGTIKASSKSRERVLQDAELTAIWKALGDDDYGTICKLLALTGCRRDEIGSLSRSEINFAQKQIELPGHRTKNGLDHIVPLSSLALSILKSREPREGSDYVFGRGQGGFSGWSQSKARLDAKLDGIDAWTLHDLRRTLSTVMHERLDVPPHIVEAVLNHISGAQRGVAGTYNRATYIDQKGTALSAYAEHVERLTRPKLSVVR
ncbi:MAG: tyrosine-type recombinase/integrase [Rhizomicrobium sp.]